MTARQERFNELMIQVLEHFGYGLELDELIQAEAEINLGLDEGYADDDIFEFACGVVESLR